MCALFYYNKLTFLRYQLFQLTYYYCPHFTIIQWFKLHGLLDGFKVLEEGYEFAVHSDMTFYFVVRRMITEFAQVCLVLIGLF